MVAKQTALSFRTRLAEVPPLDVTEYGARRTLIVVGVMMAALLQTLDATIVNVALPTIEGNIGAAIDDGTWIITGYIISNVVMIPLVPYLLQRFGRRQYYAACIIGFTVASFLCGTASTLSTMILYRVIQGAFGGGLIATSQIILRDTFGSKQIGTSSALFGIALTVGPALGPTIGGYLTATSRGPGSSTSISSPAPSPRSSCSRRCATPRRRKRWGSTSAVWRSW